MEPRTRLHLLTSAVLLLAAAPAPARMLLPQRDALALAFPGGAPERRTAFLSAAQAKAAEDLAQAKLESKIWTYYVSGSTWAYFESHLVRTMNETIMVVVGADAKVRFVEILSFAEPEDYLASTRWLSQLKDKPLNADLAPRRGLSNIAGATLTAEALTRGVRRVLAVHRVLNAKAPK